MKNEKKFRKNVFSLQKICIFEKFFVNLLAVL